MYFSAPFPVEYLVLDTDYETYSLVYSCVNSINSFNSDQRTVFSWKLGRTNSLPQAAVTAINNTVNSIDVLDERYYEVIDRSPSGCFYFPEPNNSTVIFRGQCDGNIPVQANFDAYTGTWYGIESYPAPFQDGTCGTATYTLNEETGVVYVENTQVLNQVLDVQTGIAVVVDNAKLAVTFEVNGVNITTDYWILATDYTSYSLVYSCQNINDEYKQVNSWKLSKTRSLPAAAEPLINNVINNVQVLSQQYFVPEGHSDNDCFFYPDNEGGDVVLNGQCLPDSQVPAITNFNVNLFEGTWHEVARFPSDLQEGECATTNFSPGAQNSLTITQTTVENEFQTTNVIPGTVSADGRGVFSATIDG
ncbi:Chlorophyllide A binding protein, partial [Operophtera brumata]